MAEYFMEPFRNLIYGDTGLCISAKTLLNYTALAVSHYSNSLLCQKRTRMKIFSILVFISASKYGTSAYRWTTVRISYIIVGFSQQGSSIEAITIFKSYKAQCSKK